MVGEALEAYSRTPRADWVKVWPGQTVLCVSQNYWTSFIHSSIREGLKALENYLSVSIVVTNLPDGDGKDRNIESAVVAYRNGRLLLFLIILILLYELCASSLSVKCISNFILCFWLSLSVIYIIYGSSSPVLERFYCK